ncbi:MAG: efflux RND transporter permease subunit, partial [Phycisphaeraceae bacterium]|nr:efflux RND transporter permease subunit [Phycisphaeraceae bacterium]
KPPREAAFLGSSEMAMPALVATLCTFLVLTPLMLVPGMGQFLFGPMTFAVFFTMVLAYFLSQSLVPSYSGLFLKPHAAHGDAPSRNPFARAFAAWERRIDRVIARYLRGLDWALRHRISVVAGSFLLLAAVVFWLGPRLGREFFPEVDAGSFELAVRAPSGTRVERTEEAVEQVEKFIRQSIPEHDLEMIVSQIGVSPDISSAYTPNAGPMDAIVKVQLREHRTRSAQEYVQVLRTGFAGDPKFRELDFSFDAGGMVRSALNEGKSSPLTLRITGKDQKLSYRVAELLKRDVATVNGVVDARILQRMNYPQFTINVDRAKAAELGLTQQDVMRNVVAACNSSIAFNKRNFWIDPVSKNQYYVGVQYPEADIQSIDSILDIPITSAHQPSTVLLRSVATLTRSTVPSEITHANIQATIDLTLNVQGRSLGHVSADVAKLISKYGQPGASGEWATYDPNAPGQMKLVTGSKIVMAGEYAKMQEMFTSLSFALILAALLIYFIMVALYRSFIVPLTVMLVLPLSLAGVLPMLYFTGTALNVQSLLGIIFVIGINVANTVLMTDLAQVLRRNTAGLAPTEAVRQSAAQRVRPITMTALAAFFAMVPAAFALERGSEANAPLARAILGGLLAGEPATLFVLPALYSLLVRNKPVTSSFDAPDVDHHGPAIQPAT